MRLVVFFSCSTALAVTEKAWKLLLFALHVIFFFQHGFPLRSCHGLRPLFFG